MGNFGIWAQMLPLLCFLVTILLGSPLLTLAADQGQTCATLYDQTNFGGHGLELGDGKQFSNLEEEYTNSSTTWNITASVKVTSGCLFTACNESHFDGHCQEFREELKAVPVSFANIESVNCTCATVSNIVL